ncbi:hypothetical protein [Pseudomonas sp.]|uniref:COG3014 family protein n=1 Tax=Pseudomonas sp. TaxID=306 RepID=UPI002610D8F2|nr:hypothetical protein [Pseudomonas sp.]
MAFRPMTALALVAVTQLAGCAAFRSYDTELKETNQQLATGNVDGALLTLEKNNTGEDKDLLYYFEKGELLQSKGDFAGSQTAWHAADRVVLAWEDSVKLDTDKYLSQFGSYLVNDKVRRYEGYDYEKVMLTTQMALNLLAQNDFEDARTEIKKTHEREAVIAGLRDKEYLKSEQDAQNRGVKTEFKDLKGYPVESLNAPDVIGLKNSYQSAFSHYLSGFVYEALGERGLAAPGYRQAAELRPDTPLLNQALLNLDNAGAGTDSDVLIVVQSGFAPARDSIRIPLPLPINNNIVITALSFPVIKPDLSTAAFSQIGLDGQPLNLTLLNSTTAMSRRALRDDMPGIILRTSVRAITRSVAQAQLNKANPMAGLVLGIASAVTEGADTRTWRTLPDTTQVARLRMKQGEHQLSLPSAQGGRHVQINVDRRYQVITVRVIGNQVYATGVASHVVPSDVPQALASIKQP